MTAKITGWAIQEMDVLMPSTVSTKSESDAWAKFTTNIPQAKIDGYRCVEVSISTTDAAMLLGEIEPYIDAIVCYASTIPEYKPNGIVKRIRTYLAKPEQLT